MRRQRRLPRRGGMLPPEVFWRFTADRMLELWIRDRLARGGHSDPGQVAIVTASVLDMHVREAVR